MWVKDNSALDSDDLSIAAEIRALVPLALEMNCEFKSAGRVPALPSAILRGRAERQTAAAPRTNAGPQRNPNRKWAASITAIVVVKTSPIAKSEIGPSSRESRAKTS
jgi:hypothetical protein